MRGEPIIGNLCTVLPTLSQWCCLQFCFVQDPLWKGKQNLVPKRTGMLTFSFSAATFVLYSMPAEKNLAELDNFENFFRTLWPLVGTWIWPSGAGQLVFSTVRLLEALPDVASHWVLAIERSVIQCFIRCSWLRYAAHDAALSLNVSFEKSA